ncbi:hypothetical protein, variant [Aphanomyces astaci]|nr:hypothetical protein, variant [Aphanomyces astaci]ETV74228.1 hypothetical protein, variant [Aphanomyces astaci]|eukprot:XP_009836333.1 hypothetical protein, variant [Aphanomyces astaci]
MVKQKHRFDDVWSRVVDAMLGFDQGKGRLNVVFLAHEVIRKVRGGTNDDQDNAALASSGLVRAGERIFHKLLDALDTKCRHSTVVSEILALWAKWQVRYDADMDVPTTDPLLVDDVIPSVSTVSQISSSPPPSMSTDGSTSSQVLAVMRRHHITPGAWEIYLSRANPDELFEIDHVLTLNGNYSSFLPPNALDGSSDVLGGHNRRFSGDAFLHRYVKKNFKHLIDTHQTTSSVDPDHMRTTADVLKEALVCSWEFDAEATRSIYKSDSAFIDESWRKLEARMPCDNLNAYIMSFLKRCNHNLYATNPAFVALSAALADARMTPSTSTTSSRRLLPPSGTNNDDEEAPKTTDTPDNMDEVDQKILDGIVQVWGPQLSADATLKLRELPAAVVRRLAKQAVAACVDGKPPAMSRLIVHEAKQQTKGKGKWWSPRMRATIQDAYRRLTGGKRLADDDMNPRPSQRAKDSTTTSTSTSSDSTDTTSTAGGPLTDDELAALKARIPKPPTLKFHKVKRKDIQRVETNINGTMGMAVSGIPNSGRGMFNLSEHAWPAFSVVCIFGSRRISQDMHHDGLNKVARCGEVGETFVVVNGEVKEVDKFMDQYGHRLIEYDGLVDAEGSMGGFPNDRVYEYPEEHYWDASGFYNNTILCPGCIVDPAKPESKIVLDQLYLVTWKPVEPLHEFFLAYGTSYYEEDDPNHPRKVIKR